MNEHDPNTSRSMLTAGSREIALTESSNSLVLRGLGDLDRLASDTAAEPEHEKLSDLIARLLEIGTTVARVSAIVEAGIREANESADLCRLPGEAPVTGDKEPTPVLQPLGPLVPDEVRLAALAFRMQMRLRTAQLEAANLRKHLSRKRCSENEEPPTEHMEQNGGQSARADLPPKHDGPKSQN
jgi:hypothetical protein